MIRRLLLWDIDGTLVRVPLGATVFGQAIESVLGRSCDVEVRMSGKTDPQIVNEFLALLGIGPDPELLARILSQVESRLAALGPQLAATGYACPGAAAVLSRLAEEQDLVSSVLSGNLRPNAAVKLAAFGLDRWLDLEVGAYGSDDADRRALVPVAMRRLAQAYGVRLDRDDVWVIGDTPLDLACAEAAGVHCLLVATGRSSLSELGALGADAVMEDLADTEAVVKCLLAN